MSDGLPFARSVRDVHVSLAGLNDEPADQPAANEPRTLKLCLLGFGGVARSLCGLLAAQERALAERHNLRVLITAVGTRHGSLVDTAGLAPAEALRAVGTRPAPPQAPRPAPELLAASAADVLVELTTMGAMGSLSGVAAGASYTPAATAHILDAFRLGMDVITANKGPIAWSWPAVSAAAARAGCRIRFESTVMDGLPVFSLLDFALPDCTLLGFEAVFNATTNFIIDAVGTGSTFDDALAQAQADGYAEADPANDIDGWDAASKAAALANVAMEADITPADVEKESLRDVPRERIVQARKDGRRLRLVSRVWREGPSRAIRPGERRPGERRLSDPGAAKSLGPIRAQVCAEELNPESPLAAVSGRSLGALLHTDLMADVFVSERHALLPQTAYGVYADLLHLCRTT